MTDKDFDLKLELLVQQTKLTTYLKLLNELNYKIDVVSNNILEITKKIKTTGKDIK
tara:strand:+ start:1104 stop:1271 length:168 start_codon:yes stop_codon:yes gene_type:complete